MAPKPCKQCGAPTTNPTYCKQCTRTKEQGRTKPGRDRYAGGWRYQSEQIRQEWIHIHGFICPGFNLDQWHKPPHPATDLVVDHDIGVLCRKCNSSKAATYDKQRAKQRHPTNQTKPGYNPKHKTDPTT